MLSQLRPAIVSTAFFTVLLGLAYPLAVTGAAGALFPAQATRATSAARSSARSLIGQAFTGDAYLHPRPSAAGKGYDAAASSGSNYGPLNPDYAARVKTDADALRAAGPGAIPVDAVTASGSGLDPDISPAYAQRQAARIAAARKLAPGRVEAVIAAQTRGPTLGFLGQSRVNVLKVNLALDALNREARS